MPRSVINDPLHWRRCAERSRAIAKALTDIRAKNTMEGVADSYEEMAKRAEQSKKGAKHGSLPVLALIAFPLLSDFADAALVF